MAKPQKSNSFDFREFHLDQLERYAKRWAKNYSVTQIERIILYRYDSKRQERWRARQRVNFEVTKYALVFEFSGCTHINLGTDLETVPNLDDDKCTFALKEIEHANSLVTNPLFDDSFSDAVYKNKPNTDYFRNWMYILKRPKDPLWRDILLNEPHWVLYDSKVVGSGIKPEQGHGAQINAIPCKPGTKWIDVEITKISNDAVLINTPEGKGRYHDSELQMKDWRRGDMPTILWKLLMYLCEFSGRITSETKISKIKNPSKGLSDLNKKLQDVFGIDENFCKKYNNKDGWVAKCKFNDQTESV